TPDGDIEFLGRNDFQIKIRGFRVELGEIEARLCTHPTIREAVVTAREDQPGNMRLVAYVVPAIDGSMAVIYVGQLQDYVAQTLPAHMVPSAVVVLTALPL